MTAPADGQTLEGIIGELQSSYGVPQYPQEYRITIKVADESRPPEPPAQEQPAATSARTDGARKTDGPKREKAPAAPLLMREGASPSPNRKRRRGRRRRRRGGGGGNDGGGGSSNGGTGGGTS